MTAGRSYDATGGGAAGIGKIETNVYITDSGTQSSTTSSNSDQTGRQLGQLIEGKVKEVLIQQMRAGGLLSQFGRAYG